MINRNFVLAVQVKLCTLLPNVIYTDPGLSRKHLDM